MNWHDMRLFLAAYEARSLTGAAKRLGLGQATLSRRLAQLEAQLGHSLFDRQRQGLSPTAAASLLLPHAQAMMLEMNRALSNLQQLEAKPEGVVRMAMPPAAAYDLIPPILPLLKKRHPGITLEVLAGTTLLDLNKREAELALRTQRPTGSDVIMRRLAGNRLGVFASAAYARTLPKNYGPSDLDWVVWSQPLHHLPMAQYAQELLNGRPPAFISDSILTIRRAAEYGMGAIVFPRLQAKMAGLIPLHIPTPDFPEMPVYLVTHRALRHVPRVRAVMDFMIELTEGFDEFEVWPPPGFA